MGEGVDAVDPPGMALVRRAGDLFRRQADTTNGGQDPHFIARRRLAICAQIAAPARRLIEGALRHCRLPRAIGQLASQRCYQIVRVDMLARRNRAGSPADWLAILGHHRPCGNRSQCHLVPLLHVLKQRHTQRGSARHQCAERDGYAIILMDTQKRWEHRENGLPEFW